MLVTPNNRKESIMAIDPIVLDAMKEKHGTVDTSSELYKCAERINSTQMKLTRPPKVLKLQSVSSYMQFGCCAEFINLYREKLATAPDNTVCNIMGKDIACDKEVYVALTALGYGSIHVVRERAEACANIFKTIFVTAKDGALTVDRLYKTMREFKASTYYEKELVKAMNVCLFGENEAALFWLSMIDTLGFYQEAVNAGVQWITENKFDKKTLEALLKSNYYSAKENKEFMQKIYKPAANKWMIAMLYILQSTNPAVINVKPAGSDGFM